MRKFRFNLATLLKLREREEVVARMELKEAYEELQRILAILEKLRDERVSVEEDLRVRQRRAEKIENVAEYIYYLQMLQERFALQQDEMLRVQNIVEGKRQALALVMKKRKALENLREKKYSLWEEEYRRMETVFLDEVATMGYFKDRKGMRDEK